MQIVERNALVSYAAAQMFTLVNDVQRYPEFLPWCTGAQVQDVSVTERLATLQVARGILQTQFTTRNHLTPGERIEMRLTEGPFRDLNGEWQFRDFGSEGSKVQFRVEFEFKNRLAAAALTAVFESLCGTIVDAFATRARKIYG